MSVSVQYASGKPSSHDYRRRRACVCAVSHRKGTGHVRLSQAARDLSEAQSDPLTLDTYSAQLSFLLYKSE